ncbi:MAG: hypothetical protein JWO06_3459 [Bacteroidota bacterium]|nr:hypothetical protein [Bacteroidota bacterium]
METPGITIKSLFEKGEVYTKTTIELAKLKSLETTTHVVTSLVSRLTVIIMVALFALVLNIGVALLLGELLGKSYYGFFIVAAFYLALGIVFHFFLHKWIKKPISDLIISQALQ